MSDATDDMLDKRSSPKTFAEMVQVAKSIIAERSDPDSRFSVLRELVEGLQSVCDSLSREQFEAIGDYMLRARWLGRSSSRR